MYFKTKYNDGLNRSGSLRPPRVVIGFLLWMLILSPAADLELLHGQDGSILLDRVAAVVNDEIITLTDVDKAIRFFPVLRTTEQSEDQFFARVLEDLIDYRVVYMEYKSDFVLSEEDYVNVQTAAIERVGSLEEFMRLIKTFDMEWRDFKEFVREKVVYEKVLEQQLQIRISISFKDIEDYYIQQYLPMQEQLGITPRTAIQMASQIENHLKKIYTRQKLGDWLKELRASYRIENKWQKQ